MNAGQRLRYEEVQQKLTDLAISTPYSTSVIDSLWFEWEHLPTVVMIVDKALTNGCSVDYMSSAIDGLYAGLDRNNYKSIAELWVLMLERGWY